MTDPNPTPCTWPCCVHCPTPCDEYPHPHPCIGCQVDTPALFDEGGTL